MQQTHTLSALSVLSHRRDPPIPHIHALSYIVVLLHVTTRGFFMQQLSFPESPPSAPSLIHWLWKKACSKIHLNSLLRTTRCFLDVSLLLHVLPVTSSQSSRRRVDLVLSKDGVRTLGDVVIADPTRPDLLQRSSTTQGIAANQVALDKERDYRDRYPSEAFIPFAIEIFGCLHQKFDKFLSTYADLYVKKHSSLPLSIIVSYFRQRVSIALQRAQAQALIRRGNAAGAAASRHPTQLPVHSTLPSDVFHAVGLD